MFPGTFAATTPDKPAVIRPATGETITYAQLEARSAQLAHLLVDDWGLRPGDTIAVVSDNTIEMVEIYWGALRVGLYIAAINHHLTADESSYIIDDCGARALLVSAAVADHVDVSPGAHPGVEHRVVFGGALEGFEDYRTLLEGKPTDPPADQPRGHDFLYSSGTTGRPKGALTTHRQNLTTYRAWSARTGVTGADRYLIVNPLFHCFGYKAGVLACLVRGATMVLERVFDVRKVLRAIEAERITVLPGPPTIYIELLGAGDRALFDLSSLRLAVTGAAVVPVDLVRRMRAGLFPEVLTAYGLTESCGTVSVCSADDDAETVALTAGRPIDGVEVRITDADRRPLPAGADGEVLVRGYNVMLGYVDDPEASAAAVDDDGWLTTGDVGHLDERGNLVLTGRSKDMFTVGGFNVYPAEIEQVLAGHGAVAEAAVVGVPDTRLGEVGRAYVTVRPGSVADPGVLLERCRDRLANFKVPREVVVLESLPRNAAGKVDKAALRTD